jgi:hypothetical protein
MLTRFDPGLPQVVPAPFSTRRDFQVIAIFALYMIGTYDETSV